MDACASETGGTWARIRRSWIVAVAALIAVASPLAGNAASRCRAPQELVRFKAPLHRLAAEIRRSQEIKIVALGSSSTAGAGASGRNACYPSRLEAELSRRYPDKHFTVVNLGVGGQLASSMLARIRSEVIPQHPALVIWQTGVNDAIADVGLEAFRNTLRFGVERLTSSGIDVILLDMQYYPRSEYVAGYRDYLNAMRDVGREKRIPVLHRFDIMKYWVASSQFSADELLAPDRFHANDLTYGCLADILADAIQDGVARDANLFTTRHR
jgi:acyl-CoA thioesterase I